VAAVSNAADRSFTLRMGILHSVRGSRAGFFL
jgi:hypothetical protein